MGMREGLESGRFMHRTWGQQDHLAEEEPNIPLVQSFEQVIPPATPPFHEEVARPPRPEVPPVDPLPLPRRPPSPLSPPTPADIIRPIIIRGVTPSVRHSTISIPPDGFIPEAGLDSIIRLPPPHELSRMPPSPSQTPPPQLAPQSRGPVIIPPDQPRSRKPRARAHSSPESNSTALSQLDMVNEPEPRRSPMSVILEVRSVDTSPNPQSFGFGNDLRHQPSWVGSLSSFLCVVLLLTPFV